MKRKLGGIALFLSVLALGITGCSNTENKPKEETENLIDSSPMDHIENIVLKDEMTALSDGLAAISFEGNDGFTRFMEDGGAKSDSDVISYLKENLLRNSPDLIYGGNPFGCSTFFVKSESDGYYFGRNFDWGRCKALILRSKPQDGYTSISTVNMDFIQADGMDISKLPDQIQALIGLYAPLDGMNEKGLAVSVNMIQDGENINQDTEKKDITTTTAVRLLLNQAANVEEAVALLEEYDMHASMNMMVHFAIADAEGNSVVVEYIDNQMIVTDTQVVTNFYLTEGEKYGIGTSQSHERYEILEKAIAEHETMEAADVRDSLDSVSKDNFQDTATTEWSIVMDLTKKEATYYHREDYTKGYTISLEE